MRLGVPVAAASGVQGGGDAVTSISGCRLLGGQALSQWARSCRRLGVGHGRDGIHSGSESN